jgi:ComF family protein
LLKTWWTALLDLVYPPRCPVCRSSVTSHGTLCDICLASVLWQREINLAGRKLAALDACRVLCEYTGGIKQLIHSMKFRQSREFAIHLARLLAEQLDIRWFVGIDIVVPVPLHSSRLAQRGFNQTELIFHAWAEDQGWVWLDALDRVRPTKPQWELELKERRKNLKGAFKVTRPELVQGKTVLLVDDIVTSGITLNECAKALKRSGAGKVIGLALASGADH